ncbi:MAG: hypothetical protein AB7G13_18210 [Lautropia sp.]
MTASETTMDERMMADDDDEAPVARRPDGSIDLSFYGRRAARLRRAEVDAVGAIVAAWLARALRRASPAAQVQLKIPPPVTIALPSLDASTRSQV